MIIIFIIMIISNTVYINTCSPRPSLSEAADDVEAGGAAPKRLLAAMIQY